MYLHGKRALARGAKAMGIPPPEVPGNSEPGRTSAGPWAVPATPMWTGSRCARPEWARVLVMPRADRRERPPSAVWSAPAAIKRR